MGKKMATTFKSLASYADFSAASAVKAVAKPAETRDERDSDVEAEKAQREREKAEREKAKLERPGRDAISLETQFGLTYRIEINLPDTTNVETYRAIFRAIREELLT